MKNRFALLAFIALSATAFVLWAFAGPAIPHTLIVTLRWLAMAALVVHGIQRRSLTTWIFVAMVLGAVIGHDLPRIALGYDPTTPPPAGAPEPLSLRILSLVFFRLIKTITAPIIFATLVVGIAGHADLRQVGRMGIKSLVYFEIVTTVALFLGLGMANLIRPGAGITLPPTHETLSAPRTSAGDIVLHAFPENIAKSVAEGQILQVVVFGVLFGIALALVSEEKRRPLLTLCESLAEVMFKFTNIVMYFAPLGVLGAIAGTVAHGGLGVLVNLAKIVGTLYGSLIIFILGVLLPIALLARLPLKRLIRAIAQPATIAFATATSEAALPRAMETMEAFGVPRRIVAFVLPTGYSFNLDGSTLYLAVALMFTAQAAGRHLTFGEQLLAMLTLMLTSKGVAGVPRASLVILLGALGMFGLPTEPIAIILGVDQLMDMARTSVNVTGNCLATAVIARWEGELGTEAPSEAAVAALAE
jgi:Na+/H+-dicarboxylate symporter